MRILFLGDVMGRAGRAAVAARLPGLRADWALDFVVVNGRVLVEEGQPRAIDTRRLVARHNQAARALLARAGQL